MMLNNYIQYLTNEYDTILTNCDGTTTWICHYDRVQSTADDKKRHFWSESLIAFVDIVIFLF